MKKVLVLLMVVGMVSTSNAALIWTDADMNPISEITVPDVGETVSVYVTSTTDAMYEALYLGSTDAAGDFPVRGFAAITGVSTLDAADGDLSQIMDMRANLGNIWRVDAADSGGNISGGLHWLVDITGLDYGVDMFAADVLGDSVGLTVNVIPEPMTIALLGLGGLFIRRRLA